MIYWEKMERLVTAWVCVVYMPSVVNVHTLHASFDHKLLNILCYVNPLLLQIPRGKGCNIKWSIQGTLRGLEWKWVGTCIDKCTGITEVHTKYSRDGALEHCLTALNKKLLQKGEL